MIGTIEEIAQIDEDASMRVFRAIVLASIAPAIIGTQTLPADDIVDAQRMLDDSDDCALIGVPALRKLLDRYGDRPESSLRLISAQARLKAGWLNWFRSRSIDAKHWYSSVVKLYESEEAIEFQRLVAQAKYMLGRTVTGRRDRASYFDWVISRHAATSDIDLLEIYARSLYGRADVARESGDEDLAKQLIWQAGEVYRTRITPRYPTPAGKTGMITISCVQGV